MKIYENASTARVNWEKCEGFYCGQMVNNNPPVLPVGVKWSQEGLKCLEVYLGTETFKMKNWEGMVEKMCCLSGHGCYHSYPIGEEFWSQII